MPLTAVVLAAGAGARLGELGRRSSKPMVPVAGRPLLDWVLTPLQAAGAQRLVVVGHPSDEELEAFLRAAHRGAVLVRQPTRNGIANALCHALPLVADEPAYLACACDSIFPPDDIARVIVRGRRRTGAAVVGVMDMGRAATTSRSAVWLSGHRVVEIIEKPRRGSTASGFVAMPLYWLPQSMAPFLEGVATIGGERFISTALNDFVAAGGVVEAVRLRERIEITTAADVRRAEQRLARQS
jgi:glucose-1-phosphate thymidylyltransferase